MRPLRRAAAVLALATLPLAACDDDDKGSQEAGAPAPAPVAAPAPTPAPAPAPAAGAATGLPQEGLVGLVEAARLALAGVNREDPAALDAAATAALAARQQAQCALAQGQDLAVTGWTGRVRGVYPMEETLTLQVEFTQDAFVMTSFGPGLDANLGKATALTKDSPLFDSVALLKPGDSVTFSGSFFAAPPEKGCLIVIPSLQPSEFIDYPTYFFEYTAVEKS